MAYQTVDTYEAPFVSVKNERGFWIPLEYSLLILNSGMMILNNTLEVDIPKKDIVDYFYDIKKSGNQYRFDWNKDLGYTEKDWNKIGVSSHLVNLFNGVLSFDGGSWAEMIQSFSMDSSSYDRKYGEDLAMLLCTQSDGELNALLGEMKLYQNIFFTEGEIGTFLSEYSTNLDAEVGELYENCREILKKVGNNNSSAVEYSRAYQMLENALDKQTWFSKIGGTILEVQKGISEAIPLFNTLIKIAEVSKYGQEFSNQDEFSMSALQKCMIASNSSFDDSDFVPDAMMQSMQDYVDVLSSNVIEYSALRFFQENVGEWIVNDLAIDKALGTQANVALIAWNIASDVIPFISNGLSAADKFELALYSQVFQADIFLKYQKQYNSAFQNINNIDANKLYLLSQYCYLYLKSCYVSRNAALGSLEGKRDSVKEQIQPLIKEQNSINNEIAEMLVVLKNANETNKQYVYGFLPDDNKKYLEEFDNSRLLLLVENVENIEQNSDSSIERDLKRSYLEFLKNKKYQKFIQDWEGVKPEDYTIIDIDGDGYEELIITGKEGGGFFFFTIFGYDISCDQIYAMVFQKDENDGLESFDQYYGSLMYSARYHALVYTELNNGSYFGSYFYRTIKERKLSTDFSLWFETSEAQQKEYGISGNDNTKEISESEYQDYQNECICLEWEKIENITSDSYEILNNS